VKTEQRTDDNYDQGITNMSGDEGELLPSNGHHPVFGVSGVEGDVSERSSRGHRSSVEFEFVEP